MADIDWLPPAKLREHYVDPVAVDAQDAQRVLYLAVITGQVRARCKGHMLRLDQIGAMKISILSACRPTSNCQSRTRGGNGVVLKRCLAYAALT